ncbi:response regulator [uncultured Chitinophaga sp.]|jgi:Response regulator containing a CheY-like receiver domain and an HD-GYP domain|uniref:response regulator transcription factor n=1 Tax=uncultured Chitinophaga sp. TaxID=339340 RepID=UPI00261F1099|nr:response regulator [uncultured Chitinophaga sp.]
MLPTILLVDDEEDILEFLERILSPRYRVLVTERGEDALKILDKEPVQLIISDVMMPEMDGFELCRHIKSSFEHSHIPVILLTAKNTIQSKIEGLELGADAYIEKPFSKEHLQAQISSLLANRDHLRAFFASSPLVHIRSMAHTREDERFLEALNVTILQHMEDADLNVEKLASFMNMSRITLYRKIKAVSDLTPVELINVVRLKRAAELLADGRYKIYEVANMTGFSTQSNFTRNFLRQFDMTPTEYIHSRQGKKDNQ